MAAFGYLFYSKKFEDTWAITELKNALEISNRTELDFFVVQRLAVLASAHPRIAIQCFSQLVEGDIERRGVDSWSTYARTVIEAVRQSEDETARQAAITLIHRWGARYGLVFRLCYDTTYRYTLYLLLTNNASRVVRGGSNYYPKNTCRSASRYSQPQYLAKRDAKGTNIGVGVVCDWSSPHLVDAELKVFSAHVTRLRVPALRRHSISSTYCADVMSPHLPRLLLAGPVSDLLQVSVLPL